ncbi:helitron_like_N domain-containing protein [Trichonephila clavipes]|uniref:Helitron_like_N domain-containing protein n=1 Tax=Trichonephila clavipes TaxID=2585209 RepID=A0A8X6S685_TRICX|nr:helitron_like_N domain-containing protein [Trichonephila clavipes]
MLQAKMTYNPFGPYRVLDYFLRIEFQHRGSPHAHVLLWLENDPHEKISENMPKTIQLLTDLCSVSRNDLPATEKLKKLSVINLQPIFRSTNTNHAKAMLSATIAVFFTVAPTGRNPYMGRARFELRTGVTINEETTPENNKQKKLYAFL